MSAQQRSWREGLTVGLIAYASVAVFYAAFDLLAVRGGLYTVDVLGKAVFRGLRDPAVLMLPQLPDPGAIFLYNVLHLVLSLILGVVVTRLVLEAERRPERARQVLVAFVVGFVGTVLAVGLVTRPMRAALPWWSILAANTLAVLLAARYLLNRHPGLWRRFVPN